MVSDLLPGPSSGGGTPIVNVNGTLFFRAWNGTATELWKTNGTAAGPIRVANVGPAWDTTFDRPPYFAIVKDVLYFQGFDAIHGSELWRTDGTEAGTLLLKDIRPGTSTSRPSQFHNVNGVLMFMANDGRNGVEVWKSDGTEAGTVMVSPSADWNFNVFPTGPLGVAQGTLYLAANDGTNGIELWQTDGTPTGTRLINVRPGPLSSKPNAVFTWNGNVMISANDGVYGHELRTLIDVNGAPSGQAGTASSEDIASYTFSPADFGFSDPTDTPINSFLAVKVQSLPASDAGLLHLNDQPVAASQSIEVAAIAQGRLHFQPTLNSVATSASFTFQVQDDGGTANGGTDTDPTPETFSITIRRPSPWQNRTRPHDVNGDLSVTANDALEIINYLNAFGAGLLPERGSATNFYDVNADNFITAADALAIINHLNAFGPDQLDDSSEGEPSSSAKQSPADPSPDPADSLYTLLALDTKSRRRTQ